jgi:8-oxo-dGTP pyrophosphatase MutT (NUDIX family)
MIPGNKERKTGMKKERYTLPAAVHLFLLRGDEILLLRRYNTGYEDGNYSVPAGHLDGGEEVKSAAIREAREETGIEIAPEDLRVVGVMHRKSLDERIDFFLAAEKWTGSIVNAEPDKCDELRWAHTGELPDNVIPYVRQAIANFQNNQWFDSFGWN